MYQSTCPIPEDIKVESQADYVALSYTYNFVLQMDAVFADCAEILPVASETRALLNQIERSFSALVVYLFQVSAKGKEQYQHMELLELDKWPETGILSGTKDHHWEDELEPILPSYKRKR